MVPPKSMLHPSEWNSLFFKYNTGADFRLKIVLQGRVRILARFDEVVCLESARNSLFSDCVDLFFLRSDFHS